MTRVTPANRRSTTMAGMRQDGVPLDPGVAGYRRVLRALDLPYLAATVLGVAALFEVAAEPLGPVAREPFQLALALACTLPVAAVLDYPVAAALSIAAAIGIAGTIYDRAPLAAPAALAVSLYLIARHKPPRITGFVLAPCAGLAALWFATALGYRWFGLVLLLVCAGAPAAGLARRARVNAVRRDASVRAMTDTLLEHAARGERARIARELHDVVAHHISMIAVQAEAARLTTPGMPPEGAKRLVAIGDTARSALTEMRRLLGVLREDASTESSRRPQPSLQQLNELLDEARNLAPASTRLIVRGQVAPLDPGLELTAYRIVQEALTNVRRHAPGAAVDVELEYGADAVRLRIRDNGPGPPPDGELAGLGLDGMRERVAMVDGQLSAGAGPVGGFVVEAVLPIPEAPA